MWLAPYDRGRRASRAAGPGQGRRLLGKVTGFTNGLKASETKAVERLYRRRIPREVSATWELVREVSELTGRLGRRVGVLIDRNGSVARVALGDAASIALPDLSKSRRGPGRLKGLRWLSTSLRAEEPVREDLNALVRWRLDLLLHINVELDEDGAGLPSSLREAHLVPFVDGEGGSRGYEVGPLQAPNDLRTDVPVFLQELEDAFEEATPHAEATGVDRRRPIVLAVVTTGPKHLLAEELAELRALARAAGYEVRGEIQQRRNTLDPHTLLGRGRVSDLASLALTVGADLTVTNEDLAPRQQVALEDQLNLKVIDRTQLVLDLFAQRARTHAGKLQVEAARLRYLMPRLVGKGTDLSRVGGGKGAGFGRTKGAGEKKLEIDRRRIRDRISSLERELERLRRQGTLRRRRRKKNALPHVALVGYTNVGKSTLFNRLTDSDVLVRDELFASLDPTVRQRRLPGGRRAVFSDTVGFVRRLPRSLMEAFRATLDELEDATLLLHVADAGDPHVLERVDAVRALLAELGRADLPELLVFNKADTLEDPDLFTPLARSASGAEPLVVSAAEGDLDPLVAAVDGALERLAPEDDDPSASDEDPSDEEPGDEEADEYGDAPGPAGVVSRSFTSSRGT